MQTCVEKDPTGIARWREFALMCKRASHQKEYEDALAHVEALLDNKKYNSPMGFNNEAIMLEEGGDVEGALRIYDKAVKTYPNDPSCWYNFGVTLHTFELYEEAFECYSRALELMPDMTFALVNRGLLYVGSGDTKSGVRDWQQAIRSDPEHAASRFVSGIVQLARASPDMIPMMLSMLGNPPATLKHIM